jgi:hypothetical protein
MTSHMPEIRANRRSDLSCESTAQIANRFSEIATNQPSVFQNAMDVTPDFAASGSQRDFSFRDRIRMKSCLQILLHFPVFHLCPAHKHVFL